MGSKKVMVDSTSFQRAKASFNNHYYRWAVCEAKREINEDLATLLKLKNPLVYRFLELARSMNKQQQFEFLNALVKRAHLSVLEALDETMSEKDKELIDKYLTLDTYVENGSRVIDATFERRGDDKIYQSIKKTAGPEDIDKKLLRRLTVETLRRTLGEYSVHDSLDSWWYEAKTGVWSVWTLVSANKKHAHLSYCHRISVAQGIDLRFPLSAMQWLGLGGSTDWILWQDSQVEEATETMALLIKRFLDAAPTLLAGVPEVGFKS
jgi:hypothetical protein